MRILISIKKLASYLMIVMIMSAASLAGTEMASKKVTVPVEEELFRAHEWQLDTAVQGTAGISNKHIGGSIGGNVGINYFFTKYIGLSLDNAVSGYEFHNSLFAIDHLMADFLLRYPIETWRVAPYSMVGGGGSWTVASQGYFNIGLGFDYRLTRSVAFFSDCRWLYGSTNGDLASKAYPRIGVRFIF